ncbi:MAG: phosphoenolpyruvate carboxykinase (ATP) [Gemmatimonadota bacterium]|jgi:phosphoenolpyruvate carboxykinase (ATP)
MQEQGRAKSEFGLSAHGIRNANTIWWNLSTPALYEQAVQRHEGIVAHLGPLVCRTGQYTGRSPKDRYIVKEPTTENQIWWGKVNHPFEPEAYEVLRARLTAYLQGRDLFVQDCYAGADEDHRVPVRVVNETAWHNLFVRNMFIQEHDLEKLRKHVPEYTILHAPGFQAVPEEDGTNSEAFILVHLGRREVIIGGSAYAGEIKKSMFSIMNFLLPQKGVLPMHCSANYGESKDETALFFGLSGTGKTTLSADASRTLIGDDEHGWSDNGTFNFEGGCYAKVIRLSPEGEPEIYQTTRRFGTILENVAVDSSTRRLDLDSSEFTENTRASYPIPHIPNATREGKGGHPKNVIFLTADAFGVLPPVSKLTRAQAMYHFMSGYTAKVAGTERGVTEPQPNFSACFGAPFLPLNPTVYADLLGAKVDEHGSDVWLVNTGWSGGPFGVGHRMELKYTRAMINGILDGTLANTPTVEDPVFGVHVPESCPGVPAEVLQPRNTWEDKEAYDDQARKLAGMFVENFKQFEGDASDEVKAAGPELG